MSTPNVEPTRIGVIGCGDIMRSIYAPILHGLADVRMAGVCDLDPTAAAKIAGQFPNTKPYADASAMLSDIQLDAVLILTPEKVNAAMARLVLGAKVPVYLEKPPAVTSTELEELMAAEATSPIKVYTAFNRRHAPLFSELATPDAKLRHVSGALQRSNRSVESFPYTAIHLIDSAQYYGGSLLQTWKVKFIRGSVGACWLVNGRLENGATCTLRFVPKGDDFVEFLRMETGEVAGEMQFPNASAKVPEGEIILQTRSGESLGVMRGDRGLPDVEARGFRGCLEAFLRHLKGEANARHRLSSCRSSVALMEEMLRQCAV